MMPHGRCRDRFCYYPLFLKAVVKLVGGDMVESSFGKIFIVSVVHTIIFSITNIFAFYALTYDEDPGLAAKIMVGGYLVDGIIFLVLLTRICRTTLWQTLGVAVQFVYAIGFLNLVQLVFVGLFFGDMLGAFAGSDAPSVNPLERLDRYNDIFE